MAVNIFVFSKTLQISDRVSTLEQKNQKLRIQNQQLEQTYYSLNSLRQLETVAVELGFTERAKTVFLDTLDYAQAQ